MEPAAWEQPWGFCTETIGASGGAGMSFAFTFIVFDSSLQVPELTILL
jgi:hypothetical protein